MKIFIKGVVIVLFITLFCSVQLFGQEWSKEQKEVWKNVETYWYYSTNGDVEGFLSYVQDDYSGWNNQDAIPDNKATLRKSVSYSFKTRKVLVQEIEPVAINIHGNVAIVQYYYSRIFKDVEGKEKNTSGRWTDILMKQGDKWVMIGDHGGSSATN